MSKIQNSIIIEALRAQHKPRKMLVNKMAALKTTLYCSRDLLFLLRKLVSHDTLYIMIFLLNSSSKMSESSSKI